MEPERRLPEWVILSILCALSLLVGLPSLTGQFLADDFTWVNLLCEHPLEVFLSGLHGRYMYYPIFHEHYRPLLSIPFLIDTLLFGKNAFFLHLSNLTWHVVCTIIFYKTSERFCQSLPAPYPVRIAFWAAALFAVHPFHCENLGWWTSKNDIVYSVFFLLSIYFFESKTKTNRIFSYCAFAVALTCKESALILPVLLCSSCLSKLPPNISNLSKLKLAFSETKFLFAILAVFWIGRTVCLGEIGGSYYGKLTNLWLETFPERFGSLTKLSQLWYPVDYNDGKFSQTMLRFFGASYLTMIGALIYCWMIRTRQHEKDTISLDRVRSEISCAQRQILYSILSFAFLSLVPTFLIWCPNNSLEGCRLLYLFSAPLCLLMSVLINGPLFANLSGSFRITLSLSFVALFSASSIQANIRWSTASNFCTKLMKRIETEAGKIPDDQRIIFLNLPRIVRGISIIHYAQVLQDGLRPPFFSGKNADRLTFVEPHFFAERERLSTARLRAIASGHENASVYFVSTRLADLQEGFPDPASLQFDKLDASALLHTGSSPSRLSFKPIENLIEPANGTERKGYSIPIKSTIAGSEYGILRLHFINTPKTDRLKCLLYWKDAKSSSFDVEHSLLVDEQSETVACAAPGAIPERTVTISLASDVSWLREPSIDALQITLFDTGNLTQVELLKQDMIVPRLEARDVQYSAKLRSKGVLLDTDGMLKSPTSKITFDYDASSIPSCTSVRVEVCPALMDFVDISRKQLDPGLCSKSVKSFFVTGAKSSFTIDQHLGSPVWHQLRIRPLNRLGAPVGYASGAAYIESLSEKSPTGVYK